MGRLLSALAVALAASAAAHDDDASAETRAALEDAHDRLAAAARVVTEATPEAFAGGPDRAMLGVLIAYEGEQGVLVGSVTPGGGAEAAGVVADDVITGINGEPLTGLDNPGKRLREILDDVASGDPVSLVILRDGESSEVEVVTANAHPGDLVPYFDLERPPRYVPTPDMGLRDRFEPRADDLKLVDIGEDLGAYFGVDAGVLVVDTPANSELRPGDILKRIDDADVGSSAEAYRLLAGDGEAPVEVRRRNRSVDLTVARHAGLGKFLDLRSGDGWEYEDEAVVEVYVKEPR